MTNYQHLSVKLENQTLKVILSRPKLHNAFNEEVISELVDCFFNAEQNNLVRLITIEGEGKTFCAGADLNWMKKMKNYTEDENRQDSIALAELFETINNSTKPVIGFVHGAAIGGGAGLVSVCDYVLCQEETKFGFTEVRLGLLPAVISPFVMAKIKETYARAFFLSGARFDTTTAMHMGLVHEVSCKDKWKENKKRVINSFLKAAPHAAIEAKNLISNILNLKSKEEISHFTSSTIARIRIGEEAQEGMSALLEKRTPNWIDHEQN